MWFTIAWVTVTLGLAFLAGFLAMRLNAEVEYSESLEREADKLRVQLRHALNVSARWDG